MSKSLIGMPSPRAREIVKLAANGTSDNFTRQWLFCDEMGTWEREAQSFLDNLNEQGKAIDATEPAKVNQAIAIELRLLALNAQLSSRKKKA